MKESSFTQRPKGPKSAEVAEAPFGQLEHVARVGVDCGCKLHDELGPGLLESAYEAFLAAPLRERGLVVEQQVPIAVTYKGVTLRDAFRADLIVEGQLVVEIKSLERFAAVHTKQVLTYIRLMHLPLGLLINFGADQFRDGIKRVINERIDYRAPSR